jgi:hypothetical protein
MTKWKTEVQAIFFNPFTVRSMCKWKLFICLFVDVETNRSYLFANGLNGLNGLANLGYTAMYNSIIRTASLPS